MDSAKGTGKKNVPGVNNERVTFGFDKNGVDKEPEKAVLSRDWLTPKEAANLLGVSIKTVYNWSHLGKLKVSKLHGSAHGRSRIRRAEIERVIKG